MGGKYRLRHVLSELSSRINYARLIDPFFGGGSTISTFDRATFIASDANAELMNFHLACRDNPAYLISAIRTWTDSREDFLRIRSELPTTDLDMAVRFLFLNRTAYAGMYRVNRAGVYNVPYGGGGRFVPDSLMKSIESHSQLLANGELFVEDFEIALNRAEADDLVFLDPPYSAAGHETFDRYGADPFRSASRERLATVSNTLSTSGVPIIATLPASADLLAGFSGWRLLSVQHSRTMPNGEVLIASGSDRWERLGRRIPVAQKAISKLLAESDGR
ncbi:Dam family site-specific DNA-(adenine-N6)-methyltransferase [Cryobacterium sp. TMT1-62]|nr:Dam family site-specific DNA-(adenine-N6)-methyltransferase [Cryobacterium sp. TMT1-62]